MCGIAGFSGAFDQLLLEGMGRAIAHRGPDDAGLFFDGAQNVGLAHRRLSIIDLSAAGHQPMSDANQVVTVVFNGEIYNFAALRSELEEEGISFKGHSDTEVLLYLYLRDGEAMLSRLNGIFVFALWDRRKHSLLLARDGLGVKPLYYAQTTKGLLFASEIKALLVSDAIENTINDRALAIHLTYLWCPAPETILAGVRKLEPGQAMLVRDGRIERTWRHYDLPYWQPVGSMADDDAAVEVARLVEQAVHRQMVADVPVGAFLSGGLDSSAVVAFAKRFSLDESLDCFTIGFSGVGAKDEGMTEDLPYARKVARHLGVRLHTVTVGPEMTDELETMLYHLDEPQADPAPLNALFISRLARQTGIKVLLSGAGGDDIFTGYRRHLALTQEPYWAWLPQAVRRVIERLAAEFPQDSATLRRFSKALRYAGQPPATRLASYFFWLDPSFALQLLNPDVRRGMTVQDVLSPLLAKLDALPADTPAINKMLYLEGKYFLPDHNLNYTDKVSMAAGVEVRVPLLDTDLIDFAARLRPDQKQRGAEGKWVFKKAMEPYLPRDVIYRPKTGFGAPLRRWIKHELAPLVGDVLSPVALRNRGLFDPEAVRRLLDANTRGTLDASYSVFALVCIEMWCRIFIDRRQALGS